MNKRDRRAVAISVFFIILGVISIFGGAPNLFVFAIIFLAAYWGYRFTKGDINFIKTNDE
jgi:hypothetical protein